MFYKDNHLELYAKDCRSMTELQDNSVQCVVTSPPYWGLRKYSGEQELIWGDDHCGHRWGEIIPPVNAKSGKHQGILGETLNVAQDSVRFTGNLGQFCSLCGAWKGAYGLEPTPEMYVQHTIEILREIRRVLRKDGVVFWNIGDSYAGNREKATESATATCGNTMKDVCAKFNKVSGYSKPKDLCLIPFRIAIAAQEDGWWVRSVIIWSKPNPMPESVTDRPTESHEYILLLTKNSRYYWDADAVRMPIAESTIGRGEVDFGGAKGRDYQPTADDPNYRGGSEQWGRTYKYNGGGRNIRTVWEFPTQPYPEAHFAVFPEKLPELCIKAATPEVGCCSKCGAPWERITKPTGEYAKYLRPHRINPINKLEMGEYLKKARENIGLSQDELCKKLGLNTKGHGGMVNHFENARAIPTIDQWVILKRALSLDDTFTRQITEFSEQEKEYLWEKDITIHHHLSVTLNAERATVGWQPTCKCNADKVPSLVLDPFAGAGTTLWVAKKLNRRAVGYEISQEYCQLAAERNRQQVLI